MADAADTTDAGMDALAAHRRGECVDCCDYCADERGNPGNWQLHVNGRCDDDCPYCIAEAPAVTPAPVPPRKRGRQ